MKPSIIPHIKWPNLVIYIPSAVVGYAVYLVLILVAVRYGFLHPIGVDTMFSENIEYIPADFIIPVGVGIIATAVVCYLLFYIMSFCEKRTEVLAEQAKAIEDGKPVDTLALARVKNFHIVYRLAMVIGIIATSVIAFIVMAVFVGKFVDFTFLKAITYAIGTELVVFALFDRFVGRKVADGTFKRKILDPATDAVIQKFLNPVSDDAEEEVKVEKDPTQLLVEQLVAVLNQGKKR